jgi:CHAD domain-containing protein
MGIKAITLRLGEDEPLGAGLRRVVLQVLDDASQRLEAPPSAEAVHQLRKRFKEGRAILRLMQPTIGEQAADARKILRQNARTLAGSRDAEAMVEAMEKLKSRFAAEWRVQRLGGIRRALAARGAIAAPLDFSELRTTVSDVRRTLANWPLIPDSFQAIEPALERRYAAARNAMRIALQERAPEPLHEWRKRSKELWYQARLLESLWPAVIGPFVSSLHNVAQSLGDHHDLHLLGETLQAGNLQPMIDLRLRELTDEAERIGRDVFAEKRRRWIERIGAYWAARRGDLSAATRIGPKSATRPTASAQASTA